MLEIRRREFIASLGGAAAAWPLAARAQQRAMPVIGYLSGRTADTDASMLVSVRRGLGDVGYAEGRNVAIEYRFADGRYDRLSAQLTDLTQRKVGVIVVVAGTEELVQQVRASPRPSHWAIMRFSFCGNLGKRAGSYRLCFRRPGKQSTKGQTSAPCLALNAAPSARLGTKDSPHSMQAIGPCSTRRRSLLRSLRARRWQSAQHVCALRLGSREWSRNGRPQLRQRARRKRGSW